MSEAFKTDTLIEDLTDLKSEVDGWGRNAIDEAIDRLSQLEWNFNMDEAPKDGTDLLFYDGEIRTMGHWGKVSHVPLYGWIWLIGGPEDRDLMDPPPIAWMHLPQPKTPDTGAG